MERLSREDVEAVMGVVQQAVSGIFQQAAEKLEFPIKVTATCSSGFVAHLSIAYPGRSPRSCRWRGKSRRCDSPSRSPVSVRTAGSSRA